MRRHSWILALAVTGCGMFDFLSSNQIDTLRRNRSRWEAMQISDYDYEYRRSCFCPIELVERVRIEVRNGRISRVTNVRTGSDVTTIQYASWPTVDSLFARTERLLAGGTDYRLKITYDGTFRFPAYVEGDIPGAVDDEFSEWAEAFVRK